MGANVAVVRDEADGHVSVIYDDIASPPGASATLCRENSDPGSSSAVALAAAAASTASLDVSPAGEGDDVERPRDTDDAVDRQHAPQWGSEGDAHRSTRADLASPRAVAPNAAAALDTTPPSSARLPAPPAPPPPALPSASTLRIESPTWTSVMGDAHERSSSVSSSTASARVPRAGQRRPRPHISTATLTPTPPSSGHEAAAAGTPLLARAGAAAAAAAAAAAHAQAGAPASAFAPSRQTSSTVASPTAALTPNPPSSLHTPHGPLPTVTPPPPPSSSSREEDASNGDVHAALSEALGRRASAGSGGSVGSGGSGGGGVAHARRPAPLLQRALHDAQELQQQQQQLLEQRRLPCSAAAAHQRAASHEECLLAQHALEPHTSANASTAFGRAASPWWSHTRSFSEPTSAVQFAARRPPRAAAAVVGGSAGAGAASTVPSAPPSMEDLTEAGVSGGAAPPGLPWPPLRCTPRECAIGGSPASAVAAAGSLARFAPQQLQPHPTGASLPSAATPSWATSAADPPPAAPSQLDRISPSSSFSHATASMASAAAAAAAAASMSAAAASISASSALSTPSPPPQRSLSSLNAPPPPLPRSVHASPTMSATTTTTTATASATASQHAASGPHLGSPTTTAPPPFAPTTTAAAFTSPAHSRRHPQLQHLLAAVASASTSDNNGDSAARSEEAVVGGGGGGGASPQHSWSASLTAMEGQPQPYPHYYHVTPGRSGSVGAPVGCGAGSSPVTAITTTTTAGAGGGGGSGGGAHLVTPGRRSTAPASTAITTTAHSLLTSTPTAAVPLRSPTLSTASGSNFLVHVSSGGGGGGGVHVVDAGAHAFLEPAGSQPQPVGRLPAPLPPIVHPATGAGASTATATAAAAAAAAAAATTGSAPSGAGLMAAAAATGSCAFRFPLLPPPVTSTVPGGPTGSSSSATGALNACPSPSFGFANTSLGSTSGTATVGAGGSNSTAVAAAGVGGAASGGFRSPLVFRSPFTSVLTPPSSSSRPAPPQSQQAQSQQAQSQQPQQPSCAQLASTNISSTAAARRPSPISPPPSLLHRQTPLSRSSPTRPASQPMPVDGTALLPLPLFAAVTSTHTPTSPTTPNSGPAAAAAAMAATHGRAPSFASIAAMADGCPLPPGSALLLSHANGWGSGGGGGGGGVSLSASTSLHFTSVLGAPAVSCAGVASGAGHRTFHVTSPLTPPPIGRVSGGGAESLLRSGPAWESGGASAPPRHTRASPVKEAAAAAAAGPLLPRQASPLSLPPSASASANEPPLPRASHHVSPLFLPGAPPAAAPPCAASPSGSPAPAVDGNGGGGGGASAVTPGGVGVALLPSLSPPHVVLGAARPPLCIDMAKAVTGALVTPAEDSDCLSTEWTSATTVAAVDALTTTSQDGAVHFTATALGCPAVPPPPPPPPQQQQQHWHHRHHTEFHPAQRVVAAQPAVRPLAWRVLELYASGERRRHGQEDDTEDDVALEAEGGEGLGETAVTPTSERAAPATPAEGMRAESADTPAAAAAVCAAPSAEDPSLPLGRVEAAPTTLMPTSTNACVPATAPLDTTTVVVVAAADAPATALPASPPSPTSATAHEDGAAAKADDEERATGPHVCPMRVRAARRPSLKASAEVRSRSGSSSSSSTTSSSSGSGGHHRGRGCGRSISTTSTHNNPLDEEDDGPAFVEDARSPAVYRPALERDDEEDTVDSPCCVRREVRRRWQGRRNFSGAFAAAIVARSPSASMSRRSGSTASNASLSAHLTEEQEEALAVERGFSISSILASSHHPSITTTGPGSPFLPFNGSVSGPCGSSASAFAAAAAAAAAAAGVSGGWPNYFGNPVLAVSMHSGSSGPTAVPALTGELSPRHTPIPPPAMQLHGAAAARGSPTGTFWMSTFASLSHSSSAAATTAAAAAAAAASTAAASATTTATTGAGGDGGGGAAAGQAASTETQPTTPQRGHGHHRPATPSRSSSVFAAPASGGGVSSRMHTVCSSSSISATTDRLSVSSPPFAAAVAAAAAAAAAATGASSPLAAQTGAPPRVPWMAEARGSASGCTATRASLLTSGTDMSSAAGATCTSDDGTSAAAGAAAAATSRSPSTSSSAALVGARHRRSSLAMGGGGGSTRSRRASSVTIVGVVEDDVFAPSPVFAAAMAAANAKRTLAARSLRARASESSLLLSPTSPEGSLQRSEEDAAAAGGSGCTPRRRIASGIAAAAAVAGGGEGCVSPLAEVQLSSPSLGTPGGGFSGVGGGGGNGRAGDADLRRNLLSPDTAAAAAAAAAAVRRLHRQRPIPSLTTSSGAPVSPSSSTAMSPMSPPTLLSAPTFQAESTATTTAAAAAATNAVDGSMGGAQLFPADAVESPGAPPCSGTNIYDSPAGAGAGRAAAAAPMRRTPSSVARAVASIIYRAPLAEDAAAGGHGTALSARPHNATPKVASLLRPSLRTSVSSTATTPLAPSPAARWSGDAADDGGDEADVSGVAQPRPRPPPPHHDTTEDDTAEQSSSSIAASPCRAGSGGGADGAAGLGMLDGPPAPASAPQPSLCRDERPSLAVASLAATASSFTHDAAHTNAAAAAAGNATAVRGKRAAAPLVASRLRMQRLTVGGKSSPSPTAGAAAATTPPPPSGTPTASAAAASASTPPSGRAGALRPSSADA